MRLTRDHLKRGGFTLLLVVCIGLFGFWLSRGKVEPRNRTEDADVFDIAAEEQKPQLPQPETSAPSPSDIVDIATFDPNASQFNVSPPAPSNARPGPSIPQLTGNRPDPYAAAIMNLIRRHLRRDEALQQEEFSFRISVYVTPSATIEVRGISNVRPPELRDAIARALVGVGPATEPPPSGAINPINLQYQQTG